MNQLLKYVIVDILKNKTLVAYTIVLALFSWSALGLEDNATKGTLTILNIVLLTVPLMSILFSTIYIYNSNEFIELLASHPVKRSKIWKGLFGGLSLSMVISYFIGVAIPLLIFADCEIALMLSLAGAVLSIVFVSLAFLCSMLTRDKAKGIGISIMMWLYFALLFDGLVLFILFQLADYPIEQGMVVLSALSPIDLCRILILLKLDVSAMMGYTGAVFKQTFGSELGMVISSILIFLWMMLPFCISLQRFRKKDL